jgi:hypothetical protein
MAAAKDDRTVALRCRRIREVGDRHIRRWVVDGSRMRAAMWLR